MTSQGQKWSHVEIGKFGFCRPPLNPTWPHRPPRPPRWPWEAKNGPNHHKWWYFMKKNKMTFRVGQKKSFFFFTWTDPLLLIIVIGMVMFMLVMLLVWLWCMRMPKEIKILLLNCAILTRLGNPLPFAASSTVFVGGCKTLQCCLSLFPFQSQNM